MTTITLRPRRPLESLPLSHFTTLPLPPSPISLPSKRSFASSPGSRPAESSSSKLRKVSGEAGGQETIRRKKSEITPRAKKALAEDELGMGKSPARRLFVDEGLSLGISGAVLPPSPGGPSRTLDYSDPSSNIPGPSRTLAPSPPISSLPSPVEHENGARVNPHDIGFIVHPDPPAPRSALRTPDSRPNRQSSRATRAAPPSPSISVQAQHNDQENIPPPRTTPSSSHSTPSKSSTSSSRFYDDNDIVNLTGSGRKRVRERSKLNNEVHTSAPSNEDEDELTPGRKKGLNKGKGKQKMAEEVDDA